MDWGFFLEQVIKHKLLPLSWLVLKECGDFEDKVPYYIREFLSNQFLFFEHKTDVYLNKVQKLSRQLDKNDINYALVKGIAIEKELFGHYYTRQLSDVDLLVSPNDSSKIIPILKNMGFISGRYNYLSHRVESFTRDKLLFFDMTGDHLPDQVLLINSPIIKSFNLDLSIDLNWNKNNIQALPNINLESNVVELNLFEKCSIKVLPLEFHFLYIILHLYKHSWSYRMIQRNISVRMSMFFDVLLLWESFDSNDIQKFLTILVTDELKAQVSWVLFHTDSLFKTDIVESLKLKNYLNNVYSAFGKNYEMLIWDGTIEDRLVSRNEKNLFRKEEYF
ncbi:nucleotidyltransferase family protein [Listeria booriae]|uniref:nucleotidyltransferase family protein n=1 Tax=Listeria booriae TaxID=1552123 RepID=UPI0029057F59|nr:nucleotidyltransferase family protein [Listeria booriae]